MDKLNKNKEGLQMVMKLLFLIIICTAIIQVSSAVIVYKDGTEISGDKITEYLDNSSNISSTPFPALFFFNTYCGSCRGAIDYLNDYRNQSQDVKIEYHDLDGNETNSALLNKYKSTYNSQNIHYPVVFIGDVAVVGSDDIAKYSKPIISWYLQKEKSNPLTGLLSSVLTLIGQKG